MNQHNNTSHPDAEVNFQPNKMAGRRRLLYQSINTLQASLNYNFGIVPAEVEAVPVLKSSELSGNVTSRDEARVTRAATTTVEIARNQAMLADARKKVETA